MSFHFADIDDEKEECVQIGDVVILKVGGPRLRVIDFGADGDLVTEWSDIENLQSERCYPPACVFKIKTADID